MKGDYDVTNPRKMRVILVIQMGESLRVHGVNSTVLVRSSGNEMLNGSKMVCRSVKGEPYG